VGAPGQGAQTFSFFSGHIGYAYKGTRQINYNVCNNYDAEEHMKFKSN